MWDLVPPPGIEPRRPALGTWSLSRWTTREVLTCVFLTSIILESMATNWLAGGGGGEVLPRIRVGDYILLFLLLFFFF